MVLLKQVIIIGVFIFSVIFSFNLQGAPCEQLTQKLKFIAANRSEDSFISLALLVLGHPEKIFRHCGVDVWFYPELNTFLTKKPLNNVYLLFQGNKIITVQSYRQKLNPYTEFDPDP